MYIGKILVVNLIEQKSNRLQQKVIFVQVKQTGPESESPSKERLTLGDSDRLHTFDNEGSG